MNISALLSAVLLVTSSIQDGPRVSARVSSPTPSVGETIVYTVSIENANRDVEIETPNFPTGLVLQGTQDYSEMQISFPGGRTQTRRREFALQATAPGRFRIPPVIVRVGNTSYRTTAVEVSVTGTAQPRAIATAEGAYLRATMSPETVYVGQQSTLTIEAGFSEDVRMRLTRPAVFEPPQPTGFWVQDVPGGIQSQMRVVNGDVTEVQTFQRAYFPLSPGRYSFAPARAILDVRQGFLFAPETREIRSNSAKITVLPLPERGQPADFKGAVGSYTVRAFLNSDTASVGDPVQLTVEIVGTGNMKAAPPPVLPEIRNTELFSPTENSSLSFDGAVVHGTKQFQWVLIPHSAGTIEIPAISYSFFNPSGKSYRTAATPPISLHVRPSLASGSDDGAGTTTLSALRTKPKPASLQWVHSRGFLIAQLIPVFALLAVLFAQRARRAPRRSAVLLLDLRRASAADSTYPEFLREIEAIVRRAAAERTGDPTLRTAKLHAIEHALRASGVDDSAISRVTALIDRLETERFAPSAAQAAQRDALSRDAENIVRELVRDREHVRAAVFTFALLAMQVHNPTSFNDGIELYRNGQFSAAARAFENVIAADSQDVAAWANLGNAYFRVGDRGHAVWAWARAAREAPRDGSIIRNLQAAGAVEVLRTRPPLSVRPVEWYLLAAVGWWSAIAIAIAALLRKRIALLSWALPSVIIAVIGLSVGAIADGHEYAVALQEQTRLYGDPTVHSPIVRTIQGGAGLDVIEQRGEWLRVRTVSQAEGWVEADAVGKL